MKQSSVMAASPGAPDLSEPVPAERPGDEERRRRWLLFTCCLALFVSTLDNTVANVALPSIGRQLHASTVALQWVVDGYIVVRGCLLLSAGALGDRYGRRRLFRYGLTAFGVGSLLCSLAPDVHLLIAFRVLQALGGCFLVPSSLALVTEAYPEPSERARAIGIWSATTAASTGLGPPVGGLLVDWLGWRSVFWVNLPIVAVVIALTTRFAGESRSGERRRLDIAGQLLVALVLVTLTSGFIMASDQGWLAGRVLALFAVALTALVAFVAVEWRRDEAALLAPQLFRSREFTGAAAIACTAFVVYAGFLFVNTLYLQEVRGYSALLAGLAVMPSSVGNVVLSPLSGRLTASRGPRLPLLVAGVAMTGGTVVLLAGVRAAPLPVLVAGYVLIGAGLGMVNTPITNAAVAGLPAHRAGVAGAVTSTFRQVGNSLGVALLGTVTFAEFRRSLPPGSTGGIATLRAADAATRTGAAHAFTSGLQIAYAVATAFGLVTLAITIWCFRTPSGASLANRADAHAAVVGD